MNKTFRDVFPGLKLNKDLMAVTEDVEVTRVVSSKKRDSLSVHINSSHLLMYSELNAIGGKIASELLNNQVDRVYFIQNYSLPDSYTAKAIIDAYKDSITEELSDYNHILARMFEKADFSYPDEMSVCVTVEDGSISRKHEERLHEILSKILCDRCNKNIDITFDYKEPSENIRNEHLKHRVEEQIAIISRRAEALHGGSDGDVTDAMGAGSGVLDGNGDVTSDVAGAEAVAEVSMMSAEEAIKAKIAEISERNAKSAMADKSSKDQKDEGFKGGFNRGGFKGNSFRRKVETSDNPDVLYGPDIETEYTTISDACEELGGCVVRGNVITVEERVSRKGRNIIKFEMTDYTDTISGTMFPSEEEKERLMAGLKPGANIMVEGVVEFSDFDGEVTLGRIRSVKKIDDFKLSRADKAKEKRVELHCHTKMSDMDAVAEPGALIKRAIKWGHKAIAITDHGVVQGFTDAFHAYQKLSKNNPDFKIIYGMEGYLVDDEQTICANVKEGQSLDDAFVVFDLETTGFSSVKNNIIEIGAVRIEHGEIVDKFSTFVNPKEPIPYRITQLTSITDEMVQDAPFISEIMPKFLEFAKDAIFVAHNAKFDMGFIKEKCDMLSIKHDFTYIDTVELARVLLPQLSKFKLDAVCKELKIEQESYHRAVDDARVTADVFINFIGRIKARFAEEDGIDNAEIISAGDIPLSRVNEIGNSPEEYKNRIRKLKRRHVILLAASEVGRVNLYRLVSMSHLEYYHIRPIIPKSMIQKHREGIIVGSACEQGELYAAILDERPEDEILHIANFYDYLEIQPLGNNEFMLYSDKHENINSFEDLENINKRIVALGDELGKPVVATTDAHFIDPEDEIYRRIIMAGKDFDDADNQAPLYLRTTDEMLEEFSYLGFEKAYEVVVTNTNKICDQIEKIEPVRPDKCPPVIEDSDKTLTDICYDTAHKQYGPDLPEEVQKRLEKELNSIITNGFAVMYIIAQKLVHKSNEDGYLVGSRGSVGSSFVATMAGITEVNPLPPHYYCAKCHYADFKSEEVRAFAGRGGCDMPDKACPNCGEPLKKDGFDIPFETFLGFYGDKEPDIDLNFSGEYQAKAHKYTEVIFGEGHTFKAGTVGTVAEKTAFGYVKAYYEERGVKKRNSEIARISQGLTGVRRTTGQHPGGIIVLPHGEEIHSFTPVQHPANDMTSDIITTHFDYHSIDHNLLKLDILGHDDPTMIRKLQDLTDTDPTKVALDDKEVMSLFMNTEALGVKPEDISGCKLGCLGIPEFGTDFAMGMLIEAKPQAFSDLVRIAGLSHGTDVWLGNAQDLLREGKATISTAICTRDDIMTYLINQGIEPGTAFKIMENVRKGKVAGGGCDKWPEWKEDMLAHNVPDWYVGSCEKIKYMFPKAHAAAYVMMAWRIAYYKINYPLAYYAAFLSIRATAFSYEIMCQGPEVLHRYMDDYRAREDQLTNKEADTLHDMRIVEEMYARGYEFWPLDIFAADAQYCKIIDGKIMPYIGCIDGMGETAAAGVVEACKGGPFISKDDFRERSKVSKTVVDKMAELGLLGDLPESNQLSLFDIF